MQHNDCMVPWHQTTSSNIGQKQIMPAEKHLPVSSMWSGPTKDPSQKPI